jgi:putative tryptophan/tyrosine transport system substrate-binding protein
MRRREFITLLGGAAAPWPVVARAQQPGKVPTIGYLGAITPARESQNTAAFLQRLRELGWFEGRNVTTEYRWAEGRSERTVELAAEFVRLKVDIIHVSGNENALVAKQATSVIPIVFALAGDPVGTGLVASLARPGGNVTGLSNQLTDAAGKRLELLREAVPDLRRVAIMAHVGASLSVLEMGEAQAAAGRLGLDAITLEIRRNEDIALAFDGLKGRADALYVANSTFLSADGMRITTSALAARLPTMFANREWLERGGLMSFGANFRERYRRSADLVDKILRGAKPADIPVEQPNKFELVVNLITAKAIGLTVPPSLLARADEVIE